MEIDSQSCIWMVRQESFLNICKSWWALLSSTLWIQTHLVLLLSVSWQYFSHYAMSSAFTQLNLTVLSLSSTAPSPLRQPLAPTACSPDHEVLFKSANYCPQKQPACQPVCTYHMAISTSASSFPITSWACLVEGLDIQRVKCSTSC